MNINYPLKLSCFSKKTIWGGSKLHDLFNKESNGKVGETWELSVREKERNIIQNGDCKGMSLNEYIDKFTNISSDNFQILIKFIDACDKLSVQVHPDDIMAKKLGEKRGKSEMWHIISAENDAYIIYGLKQGVCENDIRSALENGNLDSLLNKVPCKKGDTFFIPAGLVHGIGNGVLLCEIQQNSDITYRFYDYDRVDSEGKKRELHIEKALKAMKNYTMQDIESIRFSHGKNSSELANCDYFNVSKLDICNLKEISTFDSLYVSVLCLEGKGKISCGDEYYDIQSGDSFFINNSLKSFTLDGNLTVILTRVSQNNQL